MRSNPTSSTLPCCPPFLLSWQARILATVLGYAGYLAGGCCAQQVEMYRSSRAGDRLQKLASVTFVVQPDAPAAGVGAFKIDEKASYQRMFGFGATFAEAGMIALNSLDPAAKDAVFVALFDPEKGAGFSAMKTVIGATDFMSAGPFYTYNDNPGDVEMKHFSIERDLRPTGLVTFIKQARQHGHFILQATMDYPPDWMLIDSNTKKSVDPKYYDALTLYYKRYLEEYQKQGIFIDYLSLFNEPMIYTKIPYTEIRDLIKFHVGPQFHREGIRTLLQISDHDMRSNALRDFAVVLDDPEAAKYIASLAYHGYDWQFQPMRPSPLSGYKSDDGLSRVAELRRKYRLPVWMTEVCYWNGGLPWARPIPRYEFEDGDFWGHQIFNDMEAGASGWTYWNMVLDQNGGPWLVDPPHNDPDNNRQQPVVIIDREKKQVTYTGLYYYLAHFSKFVRPYSTRVGTEGKVDGVRCVTFQRSDTTLVSQIMNSRDEEMKIRLEWENKTLEISLPAGSITTCIWKGTLPSDGVRPRG